MSRENWPVVVFFVFWFLFFTWFWLHAFTIDEQGNLLVGHANSWADWAAHFTMGSSMAYRQLFLETSPLIITQKFTYPFVSNLLSALLIRGGVSFFTAFILPSYFFCLAGTGLVYLFFKVTLRKTTTAVLAAWLFMLQGGIGAWRAVAQVLSQHQSLLSLIEPATQFSREPKLGMLWTSFIDNTLIPQRAFTLGWPLGLLVLIGAYHLVLATKPDYRSRVTTWLLITTGVGWGTLPLVHTHSFLAISLIIGWWCVSSCLYHQRTNPKQLAKLIHKWLLLGVPAVLIGAYIWLSYVYQPHLGGFLRWYPGWLAPGAQVNWLVFWWRNWTVVPLLAFIMLATVSNKKEFVTWGAFGFLFILLNLFTFQPYDWDNTKLLAWVSLGFAGLLAQLAEEKLSSKNLVKKALIGLLIIFITFTGAMDVYWLSRTDTHTYQLYSQEELALAEWAKTSTPTNSVWLTSYAHNHWAYNLTGRQTLMAYPGWLWSHGYTYKALEADVQRLYLTADPDLLDAYGVNYVVVGPKELQEWPESDILFSSLFQPIHKTENYSIYQIK